MHTVCSGSVVKCAVACYGLHIQARHNNNLCHVQSNIVKKKNKEMIKEVTMIYMVSSGVHFNLENTISLPSQCVCTTVAANLCVRPNVHWGVLVLGGRGQAHHCLKVTLVFASNVDSVG